MSNIRAEFKAHAISPNVLDLIERVRIAFSTMLDEIEKCVPPGRERALVITKLQEASMFAVRGVALTPPAITWSSSAA